MIPKDISFVYDVISNDKGKQYNLINVDTDVVTHKEYGISSGRFRNPTHLFKEKVCQTRSNQDLTFKDAKQQNRFMIYEVGCVESPTIWLQDLLNNGTRKNKKNIFDLIDENNPKLYAQVRKNRAIIHIDQSMEAYPLYSEKTSHWFIDNACYYNVIHKKLDQYNIRASNIHYSTSNLYEKKIYDKWCSDNNIQDKIVIHQYPFFAQSVQHAGFLKERNEDDASITFEDHLKFKSNNNIKTFSNLNRVVRHHRTALLKMLNYYDLIKGSETSFSNPPVLETIGYPAHPAWEQKNINATKKLLPLTLDVTDFSINQAQNFFKETYLNTWYSVVTETFFQDYFKYSMFFSEKIFKPMRARHPFILVGQPYAIQELKNLGFKTFDQFWDESYDTYRNPTERLEQICRLIKKLNTYTKNDWLEIYKEMEPILEHNYKQVRFTNWSNMIDV